MKFGDSAYHLKKQLMYTVLGLGLMAILSRVDYRMMKRSSGRSLIGADILLRLVLATASRDVAARSDGSTSGGSAIQPSEFAKLRGRAAVALVLAATPPHRRTITGLIKRWA